MGNWICCLITLAVGAATFCGFGQPATNANLGANEFLDKFIFLPGGFRNMAATLSATNDAYRLALRYIGETRGGQKPVKLPEGITQLDVSNVQYKVLSWSMMMPPRPITFYGKVVDENGQPVAGATAHFEWDGTVANKNAMEFKDVPKISADETTDSVGLFSLTGKSGTELHVSVGKAGYYSSGRNRGAEYFKYSKMNLDFFYGTGDYFTPVSNQPVVYYLRKIGIGANALVTSQYGIRESFWVTVPKDGTPVKVDLQHQKTADGPLEIRQTKPDYPAHGGTIERLSPSDYAKLISATNWSVTMKISEGGLIEENQEFPFNPPESGYQSAVTLSFQKGQTNWTQHILKDYYIKFGTPPLYGQLQVETAIDQTTVILHWVINPDGSRNLEPKQGYFPSSSRWTH